MSLLRPRATRLASLRLLLFVLAMTAVGQPLIGRTHRLKATPGDVVTGYFDAHAKPSLHVATGDIVDVDSLITSTPEALERIGLPPFELQQSLRDITSAAMERGPAGHILTSPIFVDGAEPGYALEVRILSVDLAIPYGYQTCREKWTFVPDNCQEPKSRIIWLNRRRNVVDFAPGIDVPLAPFFGILGVAPTHEPGRISNLSPAMHRGNVDSKRLDAGSSAFLPVRAKGALSEVGDVHAAQGDGESGGTTLETSLRGRLHMIVHKGMRLTWARAVTATDFITLGAYPGPDRSGPDYKSRNGAS